MGGTIRILPHSHNAGGRRAETNPASLVYQGRITRTQRGSQPPPKALVYVTVGLLAVPDKPAEEYYDGPLDLSRHLIRNPEATFILRVAGESMRDAGIYDGDEMVVDRSLPPADGRIVVAVDDADMTLKRLVATPDGWLLRAAHPDHPDIVVRDGTQIWGVVTAVIHHV